MLHYYKIYLDEDKAIYRYILDKDPEREGIVELDRHATETYESFKIIKKAKDDIFGGAAKLGKKFIWNE